MEGGGDRNWYRHRCEERMGWVGAVGAVAGRGWRGGGAQMGEVGSAF